MIKASGVSELPWLLFPALETCLRPGRVAPCQQLGLYYKEWWVARSQGRLAASKWQARPHFDLAVAPCVTVSLVSSKEGTLGSRS